VAKSSFRALFIAATLLAWSVAAQAAGLGKLTVLSNLGQPLRAEIDVVSVEKNELDSLAARLASVDAYLQNNLPYPSPSLGLKLSLEQRPSGRRMALPVGGTDPRPEQPEDGAGGADGHTTLSGHQVGRATGQGRGEVHGRERHRSHLNTDLEGAPRSTRHEEAVLATRPRAIRHRVLG